MTDKASVDAYTWLDNMLRVDKTSPHPTDTKILGALDMFKAGRLAMTVDGTWDQESYKAIKNFKVGIAAVPSASGKAYSSQFVDSWLMWKGTQHPQEAWEALKPLSGVEAVTALAKAGVGGITIRRDLLASLQGTLIGDSFDATSKDAFIKGLDHTIAVPYNQYYNEIE